MSSDSKKLFIIFLVAFNSSITLGTQKTEVKMRNDMLDAADPRIGKRLAAGYCNACHSFDKNPPKLPGKRKFVGPNVYGMLGKNIASQKNFDYSPSLKKWQGKVWTINRLDKWLKNPHQFAPGNKMAFPGVLDPQERMDILAYMMSLK